MAWNPSPEVAVARDAARKLGFEQIIMVVVSRKTGRMGLITYGETKPLCDDAKILGNEAYDAVRQFMAITE